MLCVSFIMKPGYRCNLDHDFFSFFSSIAEMPCSGLQQKAKILMSGYAYDTSIGSVCDEVRL